jgi:uncharacterized protein
MNISRHEQRVLHALAQGGRIIHRREPGCGKVAEVTCITRDHMVLADCTLTVFARLRRKRLIESLGGSPYRISRLGRATVRAQPDNR